MECDIFLGETRIGTAYCYDDGEGNYYGNFLVGGYSFHTPEEVVGFLHVDREDLTFKEVVTA